MWSRCSQLALSVALVCACAGGQRTGEPGRRAAVNGPRPVLETHQGGGPMSPYEGDAESDATEDAGDEGSETEVEMGSGEAEEPEASGDADGEAEEIEVDVEIDFED